MQQGATLWPVQCSEKMWCRRFCDMDFRGVEQVIVMPSTADMTVLTRIGSAINNRVITNEEKARTSTNGEGDAHWRSPSA